MKVTGVIHIIKCFLTFFINDPILTSAVEDGREALAVKGTGSRGGWGAGAGVGVPGGEQLLSEVLFPESFA